MRMILEIDTKRLGLRSWGAEDREPFAQLNADPRVMEFFPNVMNRAESDALADRIEAGIVERGWGLWAVEIAGGEPFIGFVGLNPVPPELPCAPGVEVGWRLAYPYWGKGYATEAAQAALSVGFGHLALPEIVSFTAVPNQRSRAVMRRLHMREDAENFEHPKIPMGHPLRRHCLYRLSREEWYRTKEPHDVTPQRNDGAASTG